MKLDIFLGQLVAALLALVAYCIFQMLFIFEAEVPLGSLGGLLMILFGGVLGFIFGLVYCDSQKPKNDSTPDAV